MLYSYGIKAVSYTHLKDLEEQCRLWALDNGSLLIVTGPVITGDMKRLGKNKVAIPKSFYKVLCYYTEKGYKGIGFLFENRDYKDNSLKSMVIPIDSVEKVTGIDLSLIHILLLSGKR